MAGGAVVLGPDGRPAVPRSATLYVPSGYEQRVAFTCNVCGAGFPQEQALAWERHVGACARGHMDEIMASSPREQARGGPFDPENWDPEVEAHMREVGRTMLREGRLEVKPRERAGHS